jgi:hypothetical protein
MGGEERLVPQYMYFCYWCSAMYLILWLNMYLYMPRAPLDSSRLSRAQPLMECRAAEPASPRRGRACGEGCTCGEG